MTYLEIDNKKYFYRISKKAVDQKTAVICIHGSGSDGVVWSYQLSRLSRYYKIIIPDLPGHGRSEGPGLNSALQYAEWLEKFATGLGLDTFFLMGHSFGGAIVQEFARIHPSRLNGIVLVSTGLRFMFSRLYRGIVEGQGDVMMASLDDLKEMPEKFRRSFEILRKNSGKSLHGDLMAASLFDSSSWVSSMKIPAVVVWGANDQITSRKFSEELAARLPLSRFTVIEGAGHLVMVEARTEFNKIINEFMDACCGSSVFAKGGKIA